MCIRCFLYTYFFSSCDGFDHVKHDWFWWFLGGIWIKVNHQLCRFFHQMIGSYSRTRWWFQLRIEFLFYPKKREKWCHLSPTKNVSKGVVENRPAPFETYCWWKKSCTSWYAKISHNFLRVLSEPINCMFRNILTKKYVCFAIWFDSFRPFDEKKYSFQPQPSPNGFFLRCFNPHRYWDKLPTSTGFLPDFKNSNQQYVSPLDSMGFSGFSTFSHCGLWLCGRCWHQHSQRIHRLRQRMARRGVSEDLGFLISGSVGYPVTHFWGTKQAANVPLRDFPYKGASFGLVIYRTL